MSGSHIKVNQLMTCDDSLQALEKYNVEKDIAAFIKKEFDKKYNPTWHCIVGRNFGEHAFCLHPALCQKYYRTFCQFWLLAGSYVTHETKHFIYFYLGKHHHLHLQHQI